jgi:hypothetical protein
MNPQPYIAEQLISHRHADLVRAARAVELAKKTQWTSVAKKTNEGGEVTKSIHLIRRLLGGTAAVLAVAAIAVPTAAAAMRRAPRGRVAHSSTTPSATPRLHRA